MDDKENNDDEDKDVTFGFNFLYLLLKGEIGANSEVKDLHYNFVWFKRPKGTLSWLV